MLSSSTYGKKRQSPTLLGIVPNWFPSATQPNHTNTEFSRDLAAVVTFNQDATGCIVGNTFITVVRDNETDVVTVSVYTFANDTCNFGVELENAFGSFTIPLSDFVVDKKLELETAKFNGTIFDMVSGTFVPFGFQLTWTGFGNLRVEKTTDDLQFGSSQSHTAVNTNIRFATVTGSLTCEDDFCNSVFFFTSGTGFNSLMLHRDGFSNTHG